MHKRLSAAISTKSLQLKRALSWCMTHSLHYHFFHNAVQHHQKYTMRSNILIFVRGRLIFRNSPYAKYSMIKPQSNPPAGGPRPRLHRAQQGATNRAGIFIDHLNRAIPFSLSHAGQIASQSRVAKSRLKRRATKAGIAQDAKLRSD